MTPPSYPVNPPGQSASPDRVAELIGWWEHSATNFVKMLDGTYSSADAAKDASQLSAKALECGQELLKFWAEVLRPGKGPRPPQPSSRVPCGIDPSIRDRPLKLQTTGFRAIGYGPDYFIADADISVAPSPDIAPGAAPGFTLIVDWHHLPPDATAKTIIYEGEVYAVFSPALIPPQAPAAGQAPAPTPQLVTAPIRFIKPAFAD